MAGGQLVTVLAQLKRLVAGEPAGERSDAELLGRFLARRDADAFARIVERHGPLVWNVCVRTLRHDHDAEDAFQATFLILARKARSIQKQPSLASWLYGVAYRTATRARQRRQQERERTMQLATNHAPNPGAPGQGEGCSDWQDLRPILDEEVNQLPEKYRTPVVLCYFEGQTNDEAARTLGWPKGTVAGRLARARDLLRTRLLRRGLAFSSAGLASLIAANAATASMPGVFLSTIPPAALAFAAGKAASLSAAAIAEGVIHAMFMTKLRLTAAFCIGAILLALGGGTIAYRAFGGDEVLVPGKGGAFVETNGNGAAGLRLKSDDELLQGTWEALPGDESISMPWTKFAFERGRLTITDRNAKESVLDYRLDPKRSPKEMLVGSNKDRLLKAIYKLDGDSLEFCHTAADTSAEAPKEFASKLTTDNPPRPLATLYKLKRQKVDDKARPDAEQLLGTWVRVPADPEKVPAAEVEKWLNRADLACKRGDVTGNYTEAKVLYEALAASDNQEARTIALNRLASMRTKATPTEEFEKLTFTKDKLTFVFSQTQQEYAYKIDPTKDPKWLDFTTDEKGPGGRPTPANHSIYSIEGDTLTIRMPPSGTARPASMKADRGDFYVLKRETPPTPPSQGGEKKAAGAKPPADLELLRGAWNVVKHGDKQGWGRLTFTPDWLLLHYDTITFRCKYALDSTKSPRAIDVHGAENGSGANPVDPYQCIYQLDGDDLQIGFGTPSVRPKDFAAAEQAGQLVVLKRAQPAGQKSRDHQLIEGTWVRVPQGEQPLEQPVAGGRIVQPAQHGRKLFDKIIFLDNSMFFHFPGVNEEYLFTLDPSKPLKELEFSRLDKNREGMPNPANHSLYELDGDTLKICMPLSGTPRPEDMNSKRATLYVLKREKAAEKPKTDEELIQGAWKRTVRSEVTGEIREEDVWFFKENRVYRISPPGSEYGPFRFSLTPTDSPKRMRVTGDEVPSLVNRSPGNIKELNLFYDIQGDTLRIAIRKRQGPGDHGPLKEFPQEGSDLFEVKVFTRQGEGKNATTIPLRNTAASEVATILQQLFMNTPAKPTIVADPRTNSLILQGTAKQLEEIKQILDKLDALGAKPPKEKPVDPTQPGALSPRGRSIVKEMIDTAKKEHELRYQAFLAGKEPFDTLIGSSRRIAEATGLDPAARKDFISALETHVQRLKEIEDIAQRRVDSGVVTFKELHESKYARLEAELWLEREKAKPKGQSDGRIEIQRMRVELAEADLAAKKERVTWSETMFKKGFQPNSQLTADKAAAKAAEITLAEAKLALEALMGEKPAEEKK